MPTLQLLSDLHLEMHADGGKQFLASLDPSGVDILVLAGDICSALMLNSVLTEFCVAYPQVVYVAGNHEYYNSNVTRVTKKLAKLNAKLDNFTWLNCKLAIIDGLRIVGGTLWFPPPSPEVLALRAQLNDFHLIGEIEPWVYEEHQRCVGILQALAATADVVVTHHIPSNVCASTRFGADLRHFFVHDMTAFIKQAQPPLWMFGHTHDQWDERIGATRLVSSPLGYPHEQGDPLRGTYIPKKVFEVQPR
jgi:predicted phosphodiesterase